MVTATAILAAGLGITSPKAMAEVSLNLQTEYYSARINAHAPMQKQLLNASPISENSKKYIGYASSKINWRFRYREDASGQCRMTSNQTTLNTIVTMPEIYGATDRQSNLFKAFYAASVTFRKDVTPGLPLRRPGLSLAPGSDWAPLLAC